MKKLLSLLSILPLACAASVPVVAFSVSASNAASRAERFYALVSAQTFKSLILNDQGLSINSNTLSDSIDYKYTQKYYGSQKISKVFGDLFNPNQGGNYDPEDIVYNLYDTVFGRDKNGYSISKAFNSLKNPDNNPNPNSENLSKIFNGQEFGLQPDSKSLAPTINAASGIAQMVFGTDFSTGMASTITGVLTSNVVINALNTSDMLKTFNNIADILQNNEKSLSALTDSLTQSKVDTSKTIGEQLKSSAQDLMGGLIYLVSSHTDKDGKPVNYIYEGSDTSKAPLVFWNYLLNKTVDDDMKEVPSSTDNLIKSVSDIIPFAMTLVHYFRAFDNSRCISRNALYLFSEDKDNLEYKKEILDKKMSDDADDYWYQDGDSHYMKFNIQNLFSDLSYYLSSQYNLLKAINIIFGGVKSTGDDPDLNPFVDTIISPLLSIAESKIDSILDKANQIPIINGKIPAVKTEINKLLTSLASQLFEWISTDGQYKDANGDNKIKDVLNTLKGLIPPIVKLIPATSIPDDYKQYYNIAVLVSDVLSSNKITEFINTPWTSLWKGGIIKAVAASTFWNDSSSNRELAYGLYHLGGLKDIFNKRIGSLLGPISAVLHKQVVLPDILYSAKDLSIVQIINDLSSSIYKTNKNKVLKDNNQYAINTEALGDIVESLIPNTSNDANRVTIKQNDNIISPIMAIYYGIIYSGQSEPVSEDKNPGTFTITIPGSNPKNLITSTKNDSGTYSIDVDKNALNTLFGIAKSADTNKTYFSKGSLFYAVSRLYGHNYDGHADYPEMSQGFISLFNILSKLGTFAQNSVNALIKDKYLKYLDPKQWEVNNIKSTGLDDNSNNPDLKQTISYDIVFKNPDSGFKSIYKVVMNRSPYKGDWSPTKFFLYKTVKN